MRGPVIHLLTETDSFSDVHGGALQRWVGNVLRFEKESATVACARADSSWGLERVKTMLLPGLWAYSHLRGRYRLPWVLRQEMLRKALRPVLSNLTQGSVVWVHNRPDYAAAIADGVHAAGAKLVVHLHNSLLVSLPRMVSGSLRADCVVVCSEYLERETRRIHPELDLIRVIYNGADERRFYPAEPKEEWFDERRMPVVVLYAGRLVPEKGAHIFVEAMWLLLAKGIRAQGRVLGATGFGSTNRATKYSRSLKKDAPPNVEFVGYQSASKLAEEFRCADIFCSPSLWEEPFGLVNVEAMASALPVVSTLGGGVPEIFSSGGAVLVERGSSTELASAIEALVRDSTRRRELGEQGYSSFRRSFTWKTIHRRYREVLGSLKEEGPGTSDELKSCAPYSAEEIACQMSL